MTECPVCGTKITLENDVVQGEILVCIECGTELELFSVDPITIVEAPQEEEDWGE